MLADSNGDFGMKSTVVKFAVVGALIGAEYLVVRKSPRAGKALCDSQLVGRRGYDRPGGSQLRRAVGCASGDHRLRACFAFKA